MDSLNVAKKCIIPTIVINRNIDGIPKQKRRIIDRSLEDMNWEQSSTLFVGLSMTLTSLVRK